MFDFDGVPGAGTIIKFKNIYCDKYRILANKMAFENNKQNVNNFEIMSEPLTYQEVFKDESKSKHKLEDEIRTFYGYDK